MTTTLLVGSSPDALATELVRRLGAIAKESVLARGVFNVAVSGGSMPKILSGLAQAEGIDWSKTRIFFADERCVPLDQSDSNYKAWEGLLSSSGIPAENVVAVRTDLTPKEGLTTNCPGLISDCLTGSLPYGNRAAWLTQSGTLLLSLLLMMMMTRMLIMPSGGRLRSQSQAAFPPARGRQLGRGRRRITPHRVAPPELRRRPARGRARWPHVLAVPVAPSPGGAVEVGGAHRGLPEAAPAESDADVPGAQQLAECYVHRHRRRKGLPPSATPLRWDRRRPQVGRRVVAVSRSKGGGSRGAGAGVVCGRSGGVSMPSGDRGASDQVLGGLILFCDIVCRSWCSGPYL
ncbi:unnamed protein product [Ectocarpus sp. 4 AP-2014]